jgi:hypothetical protein
VLPLFIQKGKNKPFCDVQFVNFKTLNKMQTNQNAVAKFWQNLPPMVQTEILDTFELPEKVELEMIEEDLDFDEFWDYVYSLQEQAAQGKEEQEEVLQTTPKEATNFVAVATTQSNKQVENTQNHLTQSLVHQQVVQNVTVNVEQPKQENRKLSIAEKVAEAQKMIAVAEKKEFCEVKLKEFYGYLNGNRDGDNFTLAATDKSYKFSTNNFELIREVNEVIEKHFKQKIQGFETQLQNFQLL